jgi:hypothetical protein
MRRTSSRSSRWAAVAAVLVAVAFLAPSRALADPPSGLGDVVGGVVGGATVTSIVDDVVDVVEDATEPVADAVEDVTDDVAAAVDDVTETVADAVDEPADSIAGAVDEAVDSVTDAVGGAADGVGGTIDDVTDGAAGAVDDGTGSVDEVAGGGGTGAVDEVAGGGAGSGDGSPSAHDPAMPGDPSPRNVQPRPDARTTTSHRIPTPMDRGFGPVELGPAPALAPDLVAATGSHLRASALAAEDPCVAEPRLVCLGLLFGIGDFVDAGSEVLGTLALTGFTILLVLAVAGGLLVLGSLALGLSIRFLSRPVARAG